MTGPAKGKVRVGGLEMICERGKGEISKNEVDIYIHVKGYALARVTHLDVEYGKFQELVTPGFFLVVGEGQALRLVPGSSNLRCRLVFEHASELLSKGERTWAYLGIKKDGYFLGFKKKYIERLEKIARRLEPELF